MPLWLLKLVPYGVAALALAAAVWFIDHQGYQRAETQNKLAQARQDAVNLKLQGMLNEDKKAAEAKMQTFLTGVDQKLHDQLSNLDIENKTIVQPTLTKEIKSEVRFTDPNAGISDGMLRVLNKARSASNSSPCAATADGGVTCPVPAPEPAPR